MQQDTIPTDKGAQTIPQIVDRLMWASYQANRDEGTTHEALVNIGVGNEAMRILYDKMNKTV